MNKKIILFDGVCNLCEASVLFVIEHDINDVFRFVALDSEKGKNILNTIHLDRNKVDSIVLYVAENQYYIKSDAAIEIALHFDGLWNIMVVFKIIPKVVRNVIYDFVAKNRYKWFGKKESCLMPNPSLKNKFL
ncbi:thiol-disulfide oxidoreductase [Flavobacterium branchiophilum NBRC 15030 = ATCC 35035]|uniref:Putative DCC family thiol-disulfide oxidoreductase YuxK n=1 Tax=Flavobacterium branchiophilum TaxID=55197 RepID=A0A543G760_9FLAO|nr:DCC1-like thiol-disulfide oxidoreductase family protein [Flavobacterium branchiophilum]OXA74690.1 thiol-disulfide oxidoreductase [Flavobacterium branchiophilum NBRC 15030 = ATCC 35035]TQM41922.1 putative DCC family thiol-disulfide oxidoreductase YuxK [Flavobacterium branchiophilum]GEM55383.1 thiol-disulfide oxidoreductase [Flavobacterium branchiophilum NBRC 15030 = ATCC 35035]